MRVEVLYFDGCPNHDVVLPRRREQLAAAGISAGIELVLIRDDTEALRHRFLGSPTIRIDGEDVEPGASDREDYGLKCRLFATSEGMRGTPSDEWIADALARGERARVGPESGGGGIRTLGPG